MERIYVAAFGIVVGFLGVLSAWTAGCMVETFGLGTITAHDRAVAALVALLCTVVTLACGALLIALARAYQQQAKSPRST